MTDFTKRAKVTGITINLVDTDGNPRTVTIDPRITKALFWDDGVVKEILAPYYAKKKPEMTREQLIALFGTLGEKVIGTSKKITVTDKIIEKLWTETDDKGISLPMMAKSIFCLPAPGGEG